MHNIVQNGAKSKGKVMENKDNHKAEIYYYDIGDYLSREQKLDIITNFKSMENLPFTRLKPNEHGDWIGQRNDKFGTWIPIEADKKFDNATKSFFTTYAIGVATNRDSWVYNFSTKVLTENMKRMIDFYNQERQSFANKLKDNPDLKVDDEVTTDTTKISWTRGIKKLLEKNIEITVDEKDIITGVYRPYTNLNLCYSDGVIEMPGLSKKLFPTQNHKNFVICTQSIAGKHEFTPLITNCIADLHFNGDTHCFPLYWYETIEPEQNSLFGDDCAQIVRHEAISDFILERAQGKYGKKVQKEDIFYYVYGILHSRSYRETFSADLKKMLPRIPLVSDYEKFWAFSKAGRELADLHLNYEKVAPYPEVKVESLSKDTYEIPQPKFMPEDERMVAEGNSAATGSDDFNYYAVEQMKFPKKGQKDTIIYNHYHTIKNIPEKACEYVVNGKSAIEWIMERYAVTTDKKSGITNNPNDWSREHNKPRYILDLLLSVINVSVQTVDIVNSLPEVDWEKE